MGAPDSALDCVFAEGVFRAPMICMVPSGCFLSNSAASSGVISRIRITLLLFRDWLQEARKAIIDAERYQVLMLGSEGVHKNCRFTIVTSLLLPTLV